jgi:hypothetical protein
MLTVHTVIGGFTQRSSRWHGSLKLNEQLVSELPLGTDTRAWFHRWCDDFDKVAEHIWVLSERYSTSARVCIYAYSWGAGWGAMQFAKALKKRGIPVSVMVLSDPVYRHPRITLRWLALMRSWVAIKVPSNVREVYHFYQREDTPQGHALSPENGHTIIHPGIKLVRVHTKMDDAPEWHARSMQEARRISEAPKP